MNNTEKELEKLFNQMQNKLAEGISTILRSIDTKEKRLNGLKSMKNVPSIDTLRRVHEIGIKKEDYETCEAVKEYCKENGFKL